MKLDKPRNETPIHNKFSMLNKVIDVNGDIKQLMSKDFLFAKLDANQREVIPEIVTDMEMFMNIYDDIMDKSIKHDWDYKKKCWTSRKLNNEEITRIHKIKQRTKSFFMNKLGAIALLNRNVEGNTLLKYTFEIKDEDEIQTEQNNKSIADKISGMFKKKEGEKDD